MSTAACRTTTRRACLLYTSTKTELKNLNSFKALHDGLAYEICRQAEVLESGGTIYQETRHWDCLLYTSPMVPEPRFDRAIGQLGTGTNCALCIGFQLSGRECAWYIALIH